MFTNIIYNNKNLRQPKCPTISISLDNITTFNDTTLTHYKKVLEIVIEMEVLIIQDVVNKTGFK